MAMRLVAVAVAVCRDSAWGSAGFVGPWAGSLVMVGIISPGGRCAAASWLRFCSASARLIHSSNSAWVSWTVTFPRIL